MIYTLSNYFDFEKLHDIEYIKSKHLKKCFQPGDSSSFILKYDKSMLTKETVHTLGLFRSIIFHNNTLVGFSPPKSGYTLSYLNTMNKESTNIEDINDSINMMEEFVEGTMINVYYAGQKWNIATRSMLDGKGYYFHNNNLENSCSKKKTFRTMFLECMNYVNLEFDYLNKDYCYSFVMQHPENRIVSPITEKALYLTNVYHVYSNDYTVQSIDLSEVKQHFNTFDSLNIQYPKLFGNTKKNTVYYETRDSQKSIVCDTQTLFEIVPYTIQGFVFYIDGVRYKVRNPKYEYVRKLRGNQPKKQFHYLTLRKTGLISEYLGFYPEDSDVFSEYREQLHEFTRLLYFTYVECFIKKNIVFKDIEKYIQPYIFRLHSMYLNSLLPVGGKIRFDEVKHFVNCLHTRQQMYLINYPKRDTNTVKEVVAS